MAVANISRSRVEGLPEELQVAQEAMDLPEVQEMLRKLSGYNLGIYMPHMHDEDSGAFQALPDGVTQVEDGLMVSFQPDGEAEDRPGLSFVPVGWVWRGGASARMICTSKCVAQGTMHTSGNCRS